MSEKRNTKIKKPPIKISSRKDKGRSLQKWVCKILSDLTGIACGKDEDIEPRPMGQSGVDVVLRGDAKNIFPFSIECKNQESWSMHSWIDQAKQNEKPNTAWLLICKRNQNKPVAVMDAELFFKIIKEGVL